MGKGLSIVDLGIHTCQGISLEVTAGQCVGLTGPSGAGKTLFLRALADLDPHQGKVWLDGVDRDKVPAPQWRHQMGLLPAESAWWHDTVGPHFENVPPQDLHALGFEDAVLDWQINRLSSGERQRLALLRLLSNGPRVLLLDEPTANLDADNIARVEAVIERYQKRRQPVTLWVSHDSEQLRRNCEFIYTFHNHQLRLVSAQPSPASEPK